MRKARAPNFFSLRQISTRALARLLGRVNTSSNHGLGAVTAIPNHVIPVTWNLARPAGPVAKVPGIILA